MKPEESIYKRVKKLLIENPELRDSDRKLIAEIWKEEAKHVWGAHSLLNRLADGRLTKPATIVRTRQKIQAKHEFLKPHRP